MKSRVKPGESQAAPPPVQHAVSLESKIHEEIRAIAGELRKRAGENAGKLKKRPVDDLRLQESVEITAHALWLLKDSADTGTPKYELSKMLMEAHVKTPEALTEGEARGIYFAVVAANWLRSNVEMKNGDEDERKRFKQFQGMFDSAVKGMPELQKAVLQEALKML